LPAESPPPALGERAAVEWQAIVLRLGSQWLGRETHSLLTAFCNIKTQLDDVHAALAAFAPGVPDNRQRFQRYRELTLLRGQLSNQLLALATKLRLTPQSRVNRYWAGAEARRRFNGSTPPWAQRDGDAH
jgi:phage terminase small subunit